MFNITLSTPTDAVLLSAAFVAVSAMIGIIGDFYHVLYIYHSINPKHLIRLKIK